MLVEIDIHPSKPNIRLGVESGHWAPISNRTLGRLQIFHRIFLTLRRSRVLVLFMSSLTDIAEKHARMLGEIGEFGLNLARKLHDQSMASEDPQETAELAKAFHAVSRTLRQTMLLETRVIREAEGLAREDLEADEKRANLRIEGRRNRIATVIDRITDARCDDEDEALRIFTEVTERLDEDKFDLGFLEDPIDDQIARLCKEFGLPLPERPVGRPEPPAPKTPPDADAGHWRQAARPEDRPQPP
jgi:hypothetical protein